MTDNISLKKDFIQEPTEELVELERLGKARRVDVSIDDQDFLVEFYDRNYHTGYALKNPELFRWMFRNNGGYIGGLFFDDKLVAHQGHVPLVFTDGFKEYKGFYSASTMVDKDYRRKGIMTYLRGDVQNRYEMATSIGGSENGITLYSRMGYRLCGKFLRMIGILNFDYCKGISKDLGKNVDIIISKKTSEYDVREIDNFASISSDLDSLRMDVLKPGTFFGIKRDAEFLDWRYTEHPSFDYKRFGMWKEGVLIAIAVFRIEKVTESNFAIRILELIGNSEYTPVLVSDMFSREENYKNVGWVDWFCAGENFCKPLEEIGFKEREDWLPGIFPMLCNPIDYNRQEYPMMFWSKDESVHESLPNFRSWYVTKGDGDADRPN